MTKFCLKSTETFDPIRSRPIVQVTQITQMIQITQTTQIIQMIQITQTGWLLGGQKGSQF